MTATTTRENSSTDIERTASENTDDTDNPFTPTGHTDNDSDAGDGDGDGGDNVKQLNDSIAEQYTAVE